LAVGFRRHISQGLRSIFLFVSIDSDFLVSSLSSVTPYKRPEFCWSFSGITRWRLFDKAFIGL
jgi:hypothetical protein